MYYLIFFISVFRCLGRIYVVLARYIIELIHMEEDIKFGRWSINMKGPKKCLVCGRKCLPVDGCGVRAAVIW